VPVVQGMPAGMADQVVIIPWDLDEAERILRAGAGDIAACFYEGNLASALELDGGAVALGLYPIVTLHACSTAQTLHARFPIIFSGCFLK
jgi:hypothetical protein